MSVDHELRDNLGCLAVLMGVLVVGVFIGIFLSWAL